MNKFFILVSFLVSFSAWASGPSSYEIILEDISGSASAQTDVLACEKAERRALEDAESYADLSQYTYDFTCQNMDGGYEINESHCGCEKNPSTGLQDCIYVGTLTCWETVWYD